MFSGLLRKTPKTSGEVPLLKHKCAFNVDTNAQLNSNSDMGAVQVSSAMMPFVGRGFHSIYKHIPRDPAGFNVSYEANYEAYFEKIYLSQLFGHLLM